uniref:Uncharacterized protein n=1 Tax=Timema douglasi TaxID=61478 RepID=A0A7R8VS09_TIMDO|nr:unnamed protein product [Timema douglasi]
MLSRNTVPGLVPYSMSKHAIVSFVDGLRREMRKWSVTVHGIEPMMYRLEVVGSSHHRDWIPPRDPPLDYRQGGGYGGHSDRNRTQLTDMESYRKFLKQQWNELPEEVRRLYGDSYIDKYMVVKGPVEEGGGEIADAKTLVSEPQYVYNGPYETELFQFGTGFMSPEKVPDDIRTHTILLRPGPLAKLFPARQINRQQMLRCPTMDKATKASKNESSSNIVEVIDDLVDAAVGATPKRCNKLDQYIVVILEVLYRSYFVPIVKYAAETWTLNNHYIPGITKQILPKLCQLLNESIVDFMLDLKLYVPVSGTSAGNYKQQRGSTDPLRVVSTITKQKRIERQENGIKFLSQGYSDRMGAS